MLESINGINNCRVVAVMASVEEALRTKKKLNRKQFGKHCVEVFTLSDPRDLQKILDKNRTSGMTI
ncbi:MAG: hypothetical protein P4M11_00870 [Candidatus Pacebacteria bacterium]|nr:hypothetical protein [Candidatus Paceibacterota bacterium]